MKTKIFASYVLHKCINKVSKMKNNITDIYIINNINISYNINIMSILINKEISEIIVPETIN